MSDKTAAGVVVLTELCGSTIARTNARLSVVNVRIVSVRPFLNSRVNAVS